jgi:DegV family protein with EDD domain
VLPETAAPAPGKFEAAFRRQQSAGADAVVCINLSSDLSATMQSAQNAAKGTDGLDVRVVDSRSITSGLGTQVLLAARAAADGASADDVVALVDDLARRTHVVGALDTLDNLKKGGRIGGAQALLGSLLSIKPIVDISTGTVEEAGKARTRKKALEVLRDHIAEAGAIEHLCVNHGLAPEEAEMLDLLAPLYPRDQIRVGHIGRFRGAVPLEDLDAEFVRPHSARLVLEFLGAGEYVTNTVEVVWMSKPRIACEERIGAEHDRRIHVIGHLGHDPIVQRRGIEKRPHAGQKRQQSAGSEPKGVK